MAIQKSARHLAQEATLAEQKAKEVLRLKAVAAKKTQQKQTNIQLKKDKDALLADQKKKK